MRGIYLIIYLYITIKHNHDMKTVKAPKDGKTFCLNGRRFATMQEAKDYANIHLDAWISHTTTDGIFTYIDVVTYERQDQN